MKRCPLCPWRDKEKPNNIVPGYGPDNADYLFLGEAPGKDENKVGIPFVGKTGKELTEHYLPLAGIHPLQIFKTNTIGCLPPGDGKIDPNNPKDRALIECCFRHRVPQEINRIHPKLIIPMGGAAASLIPSLDLDMHYGFPFSWDIPDVGEYTIFPSFHPALGLHKPKEMGRLRDTFMRLKRFLRGTLTLPVDRFPHPDFTVLNTVKELDLYIQRDTDVKIVDMAIDTEVMRGGEPFCLTFSIRLGTARLVMAGNKEVLARLAWWISRWKGRILLHNRLFDRPVLLRMGVPIPHQKIVCTMMLAYNLGNLPQGLKTLAWRHLGVEMQSFDDLVKPYSASKVLDYYARGLGVKWSKPEPRLVRDNNGVWKEYKPHSVKTNLKLLFTHLGANPNLDVFKRWDNWEDQHVEIEEKLGRWPGKCISHAPFDKVLHYAAMDACRTLELYPIMRRAAGVVRRKSAYEWYQENNKTVAVGKMFALW